MAWCFSTRASIATVLSTHSCVSRRLRVKLEYSGINKSIMLLLMSCLLMSPSEAMALTMQNKLVHVIHEDGFQLTWSGSVLRNYIKAHLIIFLKWWLSFPGTSKLTRLMVQGNEVICMTTHMEIPNADFSPKTSRGQDIGWGGMESNTPRRTWVTRQDIGTTSRLDVCDAYSVVPMGGCHLVSEIKRKERVKRKLNHKIAGWK